MELDLEARRLLELTRAGRTPAPEDKLRVERLLTRSLGLAALTAAAGTAATASAKPAAVALPLKWTLGLAVPVLAAAGVAGYFARASEPAPAPVERAPLVAPAPRAPEPPAATAAPAPAPEQAPAKVPERVETVPARPAQPADKSKRGETLEAELDLLHDAQAKWRARDPNGALSLLAEHRQRYPKSELRLEREALRVHALCAAGRTAEAREVARRTFKNAPGSPLRASVEESCAKP